MSTSNLSYLLTAKSQLEQQGYEVILEQRTKNKYNVSFMYVTKNDTNFTIKVSNSTKDEVEQITSEIINGEYIANVSMASAKVEDANNRGNKEKQIRTNVKDALTNAEQNQGDGSISSFYYDEYFNKNNFLQYAFEKLSISRNRLVELAETNLEFGKLTTKEYLSNFKKFYLFGSEIFIHISNIKKINYVLKKHNVACI